MERVWIDTLEKMIQVKHMLSHPFYQAWTCGHLPKETLQEYALQYYYHVKAFPSYISSLIGRTEKVDVRASLLDNFLDEVGGNPNHMDLWRSFITALGITQEKLETTFAKPAVKNLIDTFQKICTNEPIAAGVAALYCYEKQIPAVCQTKIDGLQKWYGMTDPKGYRYFSVHETADIEHSAAEFELLNTLVNPKNKEAVLQSSEKTLGALWDFLSSF